MQTISAAQLPALFRAVGTVFQEKKDELCALDARLGDGDLGLTMSKGFGALPELLPVRRLRQEKRKINDPLSSDFGG